MSSGGAQGNRWRFKIFGAVVWAVAASAAVAEPAPDTSVASIAPAMVAGFEPTIEAEPPVMVARIDLSDQTMTVYIGDERAHTFTVSTAGRGYVTPVGRYQAQWLSPRHRSRKYNNAPMPWAVFFHGGYAIHGTTELKRLGRPASHGCVRLHPENAKAFFALVKDIGKENTFISVVR